ncbi:MAG TPA: LPS export ABC transporter periplasmic protein LptC [Steroidobacteraceae bacterium]
MILRLLFALVSLAIVGALLYLQNGGSGGTDTATTELGVSEPGFVAVQASLVETGEDGRALYRLHAARIEQPQPQGPIFLSAPRLDYQPPGGNPWTLTAQDGRMPEDARSADLSGAVHAEGLPTGAGAIMRIDTEQMHLDMTAQLATSPVTVHVDWDGNRLIGHGMRADLRNDRLQLASKVHGVLLH